MSKDARFLLRSDTVVGFNSVEKENFPGETAQNRSFYQTTATNFIIMQKKLQLMALRGLCSLVGGCSLVERNIVPT